MVRPLFGAIIYSVPGFCLLDIGGASALVAK